MKKDVVVIGGGASGLAAALEAHADDVSVIVLERESVLGGILNQCIHNGFGLEVFEEDLTGPEYASRFIEQFKTRGIDYETDTTVLEIRKTESGRFVVQGSSKNKGLLEIDAKSVILSAGCYERTRGQIKLPGSRPKGIMPAGSAQRYLNIDGYLVGKCVFILGSGDIGLIMARRMTLEGAQVLGVGEIMPYSNGLTRNIVQCLDDFDIPLYLSHTVTDIRGKKALEGITISKVDENFQPIKGTEKHFEVDTLLLSVGLIPDTMVFESLDIAMHPKTNGAVVDHTLHTSIEGLFACGNALHVHDLVDWVTQESEKAGRQAKRYVRGEIHKSTRHLPIEAGDNIGYIMPSTIAIDVFDEPFEMAFRVTQKAQRGTFHIKQNGKTIKSVKGRYIAPAEMEHVMLSPDDIDDLENTITIEMEVIA